MICWQVTASSFKASGQLAASDHASVTGSSWFTLKPETLPQLHNVKTTGGYLVSDTTLHVAHTC